MSEFAYILSICNTNGYIKPYRFIPKIQRKSIFSGYTKPVIQKEIKPVFFDIQSDIDLELENEYKSLVKNNKKSKISSKCNKIKNINRRLYYAKVWIITEEQDLHLLKNHHKRGWRKYHLDHITPISYGYKNNISPELIGGITNLRFIPYQENMKKGAKLISSSIFK